MKFTKDGLLCDCLFTVSAIGFPFKALFHGFLTADTTHWAIKVLDTGPGIPEEAQTYIFEPFRQVDGSTTRIHQGTGLGLSIVMKLVTLMEGKVFLESAEDKGTTFTIVLPILS